MSAPFEERSILTIGTTDYHTGGEPFRIVTSGVGEPAGATVLDKRSWAIGNLDDVRRFLVDEPRGHADMYGGFVTEPDDALADLGVLFFHREGFSTACGHGTIALVTWALETGVIPGVDGTGDVSVVIDVPSGRLATVAEVDRGRVDAVRFRNVPAFVSGRDLTVETSRGRLDLDVAFGGAFYAVVHAADAGLAVLPSDLGALVELAAEIKSGLAGAAAIVHRTETRLSGLYGVIFVDEIDDRLGRLEQRNVAVFADGEVDRSPCGSGTSARLAALHASGRLRSGDLFVNTSIIGTTFEARVEDEVEIDGTPAVITSVRGSAHPCGRSTFVLDPNDPLGHGFQLR